MSLWAVVLWLTMAILGQTTGVTGSSFATASVARGVLTFNATLTSSSTVCYPTLGYTSVALGVDVFGLDATVDTALTLDWSCPSL